MELDIPFLVTGRDLVIGRSRRVDSTASHQIISACLYGAGELQGISFIVMVSICAGSVLDGPALHVYSFAALVVKLDEAVAGGTIV